MLQVTAELLGERGYPKLRVGDVARRAGVGLGALYRRWPGKRDLVLAALTHAAPDYNLPLTGEAADDLLAGFEVLAEGLTGPAGRLLGGLLTDLADDPEFTEAVRETVIAPLRAQTRARLHRVIGDHPDLDVRADLGPAWILFRVVLIGQTVTDTELHALRATLLGP